MGNQSKPLIVDTKALIDDRNPRIAMSFARIDDRDAIIDDTKPLIANAKLCSTGATAFTTSIMPPTEVGWPHFLLNRS